jgi:ribose-phosphate pyrophosphokinase
MELLPDDDAAKRAQQDIHVIPYFGWARQDRKKRQAKSSDRTNNKTVRNCRTTKWTMDLHADQIQVLKNRLIIFASTIFYHTCEKLDNLNRFSRYGGSKRAYAYSKFLGSDVVICYKQRGHYRQNGIDLVKLKVKV